MILQRCCAYYVMAQHIICFLVSILVYLRCKAADSGTCNSMAAVTMRVGKHARGIAHTVACMAHAYSTNSAGQRQLEANAAGACCFLLVSALEVCLEWLMPASNILVRYKWSTFVTRKCMMLLHCIHTFRNDTPLEH
jgi:hypothetical protein